MSLNIIAKYSLLGAVSLTALTGAATAQGQSSDKSEMLFEEIIVTAGRREQSLQDVPASVVAINPDDFKVKGIKQIGEILDYTPGVVFQTGGAPGLGNISARGVPQSSATPVFGIYLDDIPLSSNTNFAGGGNIIFDGLLMDIERVEVIKGPQGTLYGATSVGGMMRYISRDPALQEFRGSVGADIATTKGGEMSKIFNGRVSVPVVEDKLGVTFSGFYQDTGGYVDQVDGTGALVQEDYNGSEVTGYMADALFTPTDELRIRLKYLKQEMDFSADATTTLVPQGDEALFGGYSNINPPGPKFLDFRIMSGSIEYDLGWGTVTSTTSHSKYSYGGYSDFTADYAIYADLFDGRAPGTTTQVDFDQTLGSKKFVQEVRLTSERMGAFEWIAGLYYASEDTINNQSLQATPAFDLLTIAFPSDYTEKAAFGDVTYYVNDNFDITAGARISKNKIILSYIASGVFLPPGDLVNTPVKDTVDTYLLAARYRVHDDMSFYARVASGYRPAQSNIPVLDTNGVNVAPAFVASDHAWSYELGVKGNFADNMFAYDVALWKIDWANFQASVFLNGISTGGNAEDGLSAYGLDGSFIVRPVDALTLTASIAYSHSTLKSDEPTIGGVEGEFLPNLPKWTASLQWDYRVDVVDSWTANFGGGFRYAGKSISAYSQAPGSAATQLDSRLITDLNVTLSSENLSFTVYARNLFDEYKLTNRQDPILGADPVTGDPIVSSSGVYERPRTIGVNMKIDF
ncbi:TonB-dependent receptor [Kordiimonas pumila]|uniref:TonB-dependent receptor n=1 Tax=Kordiimonas pumila TaxID=2161677 RepID=A0ABV7D4I6_9PROT|nr:TonB-dependent receptor plug domain-containing protein [Kordiimonas pumila]